MKVVQALLHPLALHEVKRGKGKADEMLGSGIPPPGQNNWRLCIKVQENLRGLPQDKSAIPNW